MPNFRIFAVDIPMEKNAIKNIVILGTGNVAYHLSRAFHLAGYNIRQIYGRDPGKAGALARTVSSDPVSDLHQLYMDADAYFFCVTDAGLADLTGKTWLGEKMAVHVSGSMDMQIMSRVSENYGVFYPLQTLSENTPVDFITVPVFLEANNKNNARRLTQLARGLTSLVFEAGSEQRLIMHISAVFACNFTNYLYGIAEALMESHNMDFRHLMPLIMETAGKAREISPKKAQTGPAKRKDMHIIDKHLERLDAYPEYKRIYEMLSGQIQDLYDV